jgi:hypothetical protein
MKDGRNRVAGDDWGVEGIFQVLTEPAKVFYVSERFVDFGHSLVAPPVQPRNVSIG